ncbi:hypothetical protein Taro_008970, partial [Colocasia esculenta]|nr:hypothetical protein [Colocasia esculenta]
MFRAFCVLHMSVMKVTTFSYVFGLGSESQPDQATRFQRLVVMRIQWTPMGQDKSEEHPSYEESTICSFFSTSLLSPELGLDSHVLYVERL